MIPIKKFTIGIRPSSKIFRISSEAGLIIDEILKHRDTKYIDADYFSEVSKNYEQGVFHLKDESGINFLQLDTDNIIFTKDYYKSNKMVKIDQFIKEFEVLWGAVNSILKVTNIRRIGIVTEHRIPFPDNDVTKLFLEKYTSFNTKGHPVKFNLRFEERRLLKDGSIPNLKESHFLNVIKSYYESNQDIEHPEDAVFNVSLDVQQYFSPLLSHSIIDEIKKLNRLLDNERRDVTNELKEHGLY